MILVESPSLLHRLWQALPALLRRPARAPRASRFAFSIPAGRTEEVRAADRRMTIRCTEGEVWLTHDGDVKDLLLRPGQGYTVERAGRMMLHALAASGVEVRFG